MTDEAQKIARRAELGDLPAYQVVEAAHYLRIPYFQLYSWLKPVTFETSDGYCTKALIERPGGSNKLSFLNLIEGHVIKALRHEHSVPVREIRAAIEYAEREVQIPRLLISPELRAGAKQLFVRWYGHLINLGRGGQYALEKMIERYLERIDYAENMPQRLFPFIEEADDQKLISISPDLSFGKPVVFSSAISTRVIADRYELGETQDEIARDFGLKDTEVEQAIIYEAV